MHPVQAVKIARCKVLRHLTTLGAFAYEIAEKVSFFSAQAFEQELFVGLQCAQGDGQVRSLLRHMLST